MCPARQGAIEPLVNRLRRNEPLLAARADPMNKRRRLNSPAHGQAGTLRHVRTGVPDGQCILATYAHKATESMPFFFSN